MLSADKRRVIQRMDLAWLMVPSHEATIRSSLASALVKHHGAQKSSYFKSYNSIGFLLDSWPQKDLSHKISIYVGFYCVLALL